MTGNRNAMKPECEVKTAALKVPCTQEYRDKVGRRAKDFGGMGNYIRGLIDADLEAIRHSRRDG